MNTLEWDLPFAKWLSDSTLNASVNCVDRHVAAGKGDKVAYHWVGDAEGESGKIMRRLLRDVAENRSLGDVTTLTDPTVVNMISDLIGSEASSED
jgi:hypothetical protein